MNCKICRDEIEESDSGRPLGEGAIAHMESCSNCLAFRDERLTLKQMIDNLGVVTAPADFDFRLRARLAALKGREPGRKAWNRFVPGTWAVTLAAVFVIVLALGIVVRQLDKSVNREPQSIVKFNANSAVVPKTGLVLPTRATANDALVAQSPNERRSPVIVQRQGTSTPHVNKLNPSANASTAKPDEGGGSVDSAVSPAANVMPLGISDPTLPRSGVADERSTGNASLDPLLARGMKTLPIAADLAARLKIRGGRMVVFVEPSSAASRAGIVAGDVIASIDKKPISRNNLPNSLPNKIALVVIRDGHKLVFQIETEITSPTRSKR